MMGLMGDDLRLVAIQGFARCFTLIMFGAAIGNWIDRSKRLTSAQVFLTLQNILVALDCFLLAAYFYVPEWFDDLFKSPETSVNVVSGVVIAIATLANLASVGSKIVLEKDWIVVVSMNDPERLASMNAVFRTIDLLTLMLSPIVGGLLFDFVGYSFAAIFIGCWNVVSVIVEYLLLILIYRDFPELARKDHLERLEGAEESIGQKLKRSLDSWVMFYKHPVFFAGVALSTTYMTVLGLDNVTYGYALQQCVRESVLGGLVAISAVIGILGSIAFPFLRKKLNVTRTGVIGFATLGATFIPTVISIFLPGSPFQLVPGHNETHIPPVGQPEEECYVSSRASILTFLIAITAARFGLWVSDLSITQILQEGVEEQVRGTVGGVQNSLNSILDTIKYILVIVFPDEDTFGYLVMASVATILVGALFYIIYAIQNWHGTTLPRDAEVQSLASSRRSDRYGGTDNHTGATASL